MNRTMFDEIISDMFTPGKTSLFYNTKLITPDKDIIERIKLLGDLEQKDRDGRTLIINAACYSRNEIMNYLLNQGVNVNAEDNNGFTALHFSVMANNYLGVEKLIKSGANVNAKNVFGNNILLVTDLKTDLRIFRLLVAHGANPDDKNNYGISARRCFEDYPEILRAMEL